MISIYFQYPYFLFLLFLVPLYVFIYFFSFLYHKKRAVNFPNFEAMERVSGSGIFSRTFFSFYLTLIILILVILSLAGATLSFETLSSSYDYVIAIDNSGSMKAIDYTPNRLTAAKELAKAFVDSLPVGSNVGVLEFSGNIESIQPLTTSKIKVKMAIDSIDFSEIEGTDMYNTILVSGRLLERSDNKAIILLSDGRINIGTLYQAVQYSTENKIMINSFAIGTKEGGVLPNDMGISKLDEDSLKSLSYNTGGKFFKVENPDQLSEAFSSLLVKSQKQVSLELSMYFLLAVVLIFTINWILYNFRLRIFP
jgi:Ca-activated chloride channel homolog